MKKKILIILFVLVLLCGCGKTGSGRKVTAIDSDIDYISIRDYKIYLTENFEDYVLQFQGLGCKFQAQDSNIKDSFEIDNIKSKDHPFYTLTGGYRFDISCPIAGNVSSADFDGYLEQTSANYTDRVIKRWRIDSLQEVIKVKTKNHGTLIFGDDDNHETIDSIRQKYGEPTEEEKDYYGKIESMNYKSDNNDLEFIVMNSLTSTGDEVYGFYLERK